MPIKRYSPEQIIGVLRQVEIGLAKGKTAGEVCRSLGISVQSYDRWRKEYVGVEVAQARRPNDLERKNTRLKKLVDCTNGIGSDST